MWDAYQIPIRVLWDLYQLWKTKSSMRFKTYTLAS